MIFKEIKLIKIKLKYYFKKYNYKNNKQKYY